MKSIKTVCCISIGFEFGCSGKIDEITFNGSSLLFYFRDVFLFSLDLREYYLKYDKKFTQLVNDGCKIYSIEKRGLSNV